MVKIKGGEAEAEAEEEEEEEEAEEEEEERGKEFVQNFGGKPVVKHRLGRRRRS
jgi:hypothetical protein